MTERQRMLTRLALSFMLSNLPEIENLFRVESDDPEHPAYGHDDKLEYQSEIIDKPTESEIEDILSLLQG